MNAVADTVQKSSESHHGADALSRSAKLDVVSGLQQGAVAWLQPSVALTVGSGFDNDIVLRDPHIKRQHLMVTLEQDTIHIQCLSGDVLVDGIAYSAGDNTACSSSSLVQINSVGLSIVCNNPSSSNTCPADSSMQLAPGVEQADSLSTEPAFFIPPVDALPEASDQAGAQQQPRENVPKTNHRAGFLTAVALMVGAIIVWQSGLFSKSSQQPASLASMLALSPFAALTVSQEGNTATVSGYVETVNDSMQLGQWLEQSGLLIRNEVMVGETLAEQVSDVFRVNGVMAEVDVVEGGIVSAITREADTQLLKTIEERIMSDVPLVTRLEIDNNPPPQVANDDVLTIVDPGKRVVMVVSDEPAYIVTEDQSRYFVGSPLPTGHRIADIKDGKVLLEKQGVSTTLEF
ncbi:MAG: FHA domain-containing protein [Granulosicoccus sp.]